MLVHTTITKLIYYLFPNFSTIRLHIESRFITVSSECLVENTITPRTKWVEIRDQFPNFPLPLRQYFSKWDTTQREEEPILPSIATVVQQIRQKKKKTGKLHLPTKWQSIAVNTTTRRRWPMTRNCLRRRSFVCDNERTSGGEGDRNGELAINPFPPPPWVDKFLPPGYGACDVCTALRYTVGLHCSLFTVHCCCLNKQCSNSMNLSV